MSKHKFNNNQLFIIHHKIIKQNNTLFSRLEIYNNVYGNIDFETYNFKNIQHFGNPIEAIQLTIKGIEDKINSYKMFKTIFYTKKSIKYDKLLNKHKNDLDFLKELLKSNVQIVYSESNEIYTLDPDSIPKQLSYWNSKVNEFEYTFTLVY